MDFAEELPAVDPSSLAVLSRNVAESAQILFNAGSVIDTLTSVVDLAVTTIEGCDFAGIVLLDDGGKLSTPVHTHPLVVEADALQELCGEGPGLDAIAQRSVFYAEDLDTDHRWPDFSRRAAATGLRSVLSFPLSADDRLGALNLYARSPLAFGVVDRATGAILSSLAGHALSVARSHEDEERRALNFQAALSTREVIGEALGILMERERISADQAFDVLRRASQYLNIKLREVAQNLVDTGEDPDTGPAPRSH